MKVLVLTTSYPRGADDPAGRFVADAVEGARSRGVEVEVVSPRSFRHFGLAYGHGIVGNIGRRPWLALLVPAFLWNFRRATLARECDLVHAHWLAAGAVAATLGKPYIVQVWGTDVELARRAPWAARWILRRARLVLAASSFLAEAARRLGAQDVRIVPSAVGIPETVGEPEEPPHVLFAGRLSPEKGIEDFLSATEGLPRVIVGAGPIRVPESVGAVSPSELGRYYERAAVVCVPSRREGYGMVAREAMAYGRPVVATPVGGLLDAVEDGVNGLVVEHADLRRTIERLLDDAAERKRIGAAARDKARRAWSGSTAATSLVAAYQVGSSRGATAEKGIPNGRRLGRALHLRQLAERLGDRRLLSRRATQYVGFSLAYGRGNSLVARIESTGQYEPETIGAIVRTLAESESRVLVDVGANIGLVSLAALASVPEATVYAFEPGRYQRRLLAETIRRNGLEDRLVLSSLALSNRPGTAEFAVHSRSHAAGDGFLDTGRGGRSRSVRVRKETLDRWWEANGRPPVSVMKLDTEGSELLILRGAPTLLDHCRPVIFLEIHDENLRVYPYDAADVRGELERMGYRLEELEETEYVAWPA